MAQVVDAATEVGAAYEGDADRPLASYAGALAAYAGVVLLLIVIVRRRRVPIPDRIAAADLALIAVATHKLSRTLAKDAVASPLRAPFTSYKGPAGAAELNEEVRVSGSLHGIAELISCPFCLAQWIATAFVAGLVLAPRATRLLAGVFAARAGSDVLQFAYCWLQGHAA